MAALTASAEQEINISLKSVAVVLLKAQLMLPSAVSPSKVNVPLATPSMGLLDSAKRKLAIRLPSVPASRSVT